MGELTCTISDCERNYLCKGLCSMHYKRAKKGQDMFKIPKIVGNDEARFYSRALKTDTCWLWQGKLKPDGYARLHIGDKLLYVHIFSYKLHKGEYDSELQIDHLCKVRHCVNPDHLEAVTQKVNMSRSAHAIRTHCPKGHSYTGINLYLNPAGSRACRKCHKERARVWYLRNRRLANAT